MIYARELQQGVLGTAYWFLGFGVEEGGVVGGKRKAELFDSVREEARFRRLERLRRVDIEGQLRVIIGDSVRFRGSESRIVQVVGTREGKIIKGGLEKYLGGKIIVYSGQIKRGDKVDTYEGKARWIVEWMEKGGVIVTTNALGIGIDIPNVRMRLRDYAQESGRAGRDGEKSEAIIIHRVQKGRQPKKQTRGKEGWLEKGMEELVGGKICCRVVLDRIMDGWEGRERCLEGEEMYHMCKRGRVEL
ncbi:hypothetical protein V8F33_014206 [Rhypophila sp. PSN 637]